MTQPAPAVPLIHEMILRLAAARGPEKSICPSEVARALAEQGAWQPLMPAVRHAAIALARSGRLDILRHGRRVEPDAVRGVIRLRATGLSPQAAEPSSGSFPGTPAPSE